MLLAVISFSAVNTACFASDSPVDDLLKKEKEIISKYGKNCTEVIPVYYSLAAAYAISNDLENAKKYNQKVLDICIKKYGANSLQTGKAYNNVGITYSLSGKYPQAVESYEKALAIQKSVSKKENEDIWEIYYNIALCYFAQKDFSNALSTLDKIKIDLPPEHYKMQASVDELYGKIYYCTDEYAKAVKYFEYSLDMYFMYSKQEHPHKKTIEQWIGDCRQVLSQQETDK